MEAAEYNPLEAQRIEYQLERIWWERYLAVREIRTKIALEEQRKAQRTMRRGR